MEPRIDDTEFGSITVAGEKYENDVFIRLSGRIEKRRKQLSRQASGDAHIISLAEAQHVFEDGARRIIIGTGQSGMVKLSTEAAAFLQERGCVAQLLPTPKAIDRWNETEEAAIGLFHVTC